MNNRLTFSYIDCINYAMTCVSDMLTLMTSNVNLLFKLTNILYNSYMIYIDFYFSLYK